MLPSHCRATLGNDTKLRLMRTALMPIFLLLFTHLHVGGWLLITNYIKLPTLSKRICYGDPFRGTKQHNADLICIILLQLELATEFFD